MPDELYERLRRAAFEDRRSQNDIMIEALAEKLDSRDRQGGEA